MIWDPDVYARFADDRLRPGLELLARVRDEQPSHVLDLGSGPGDLTALLRRRWPVADIVGVDSSSEMLDAARRLDTSITWIDGDLDRWAPDRPADVVFSNATLHWLDHHEALFRRIAEWVAPGGTLAVQMPDNWTEPTHRIPARIIDEPGWPSEARDALMRDRLATAASYRSWLVDSFEALDLWTTTYHHVLTGSDPVLTWVKGSVLRPVLAALTAEDAAMFEDLCRRAYAEAYPPEPDGTTILPFRRFFVIASGKRPAAVG